MQSEQQSKENFNFTLSDAAKLVFFVAFIWALPWELLMRRQFGRRYIDLWIFPAAIWPMIFASFIPEFSATWSFWAFGLIIILGIYHRVVANILDHRGVIRHTQYSGFPVLCYVLPLEEVRCKKLWEPLVVMFVSFLAIPFCPSLGLFLTGSWLAGGIKRAMKETYQQEEVADLRDAYLEQQDLAERFRGGQ